MSPHDIIRLLRDNYEGTKYDLTVGAAAGIAGSPLRYSGGAVEKKYQGAGQWERGISIHRTSW